MAATPITPTLEDLRPLLTTTSFALEPNGLLTIFLDRPQNLNAFTVRMADELENLFAAAEDSRVKVIILTGQGEKAFCAGFDLQSSSQVIKPTDFVQGLHRDEGGVVSLAIYRCSKPVIAAIQGHAVGIGITMTLPCDIRIASSSAKIAFPFAKRSLVNEGCSTYLLPRLVGITQALEWTLTGRTFLASEADSTGLFTKVVDGGAAGVTTEARKIALQILRNNPTSVVLIKSMLWEGLKMDSPYEAHLLESNVIAQRFRGQDFMESMKSFMLKRAPNFQSDPNNPEDMPKIWPIRSFQHGVISKL
eukprot:TRINITY_DN3216_c0_g2_i1.p1 TRINITY_DN3216_c0_g2~~TRINITY_DN3216_c0_g2_i1.p1  ORF type:complete len:317 (-),score=62.87 TRINITY_DN3216_c0_g2_i1:120-1034(-)